MPSLPESNLHFYLGLAEAHLPIIRIPQRGGPREESSPLFKEAERVEMSPSGLAEAREMVHQMSDVLKSYGGITGMKRGWLAANQIGIPKRIIAFYDRTTGESRHYLNFQITSKTLAINKTREFCLSGVPLGVNVARSAEIEAEWDDLDGNHHTGSFDGRDARALQHEDDHLNGHTCYDAIGTDLLSIVEAQEYEDMASGDLEPIL